MCRGRLLNQGGGRRGGRKKKEMAIKAKSNTFLVNMPPINGGYAIRNKTSLWKSSFGHRMILYTPNKDRERIHMCPCECHEQLTFKN
jgi:hypothetical protein